MIRYDVLLRLTWSRFEDHPTWTIQKSKGDFTRRPQEKTFQHARSSGVQHFQLYQVRQKKTGGAKHQSPSLAILQTACMLRPFCPQLQPRWWDWTGKATSPDSPGTKGLFSQPQQALLATEYAQILLGMAPFPSAGGRSRMVNRSNSGRVRNLIHLSREAKEASIYLITRDEDRTSPE